MISTQILHYFLSLIRFHCCLKVHWNPNKTPPYNAISDTTLIFLGSQMIFKNYLWGSADVNSPIFAHIGTSNYLIYINISTF